MKPEFNVTLDGTRLDGEAKGAVSGVRVFLTHSGASAFEIVVDDPELRWQAKPTFTECKEVQIELGVPGKMKKVFDGEVTAWRTELERAGPTVLVLRGMDRSHRLMRGHKTKTYAEASPIDCAQQIASAAGLTAKTSAGQPAPVKTFRIQANESDFGFLRKMADLEGYLFYVDGSDLHFERPKLSSKDDLTITFGEDVKTFLPVANFRRPAAKVEVGGWDSAGKAALTGKAKPGDEMWSVPGGKPGAEVATFQGTKASIGIVESQVATQEHADTVAKAALTRRSLEFLTAEVEVQGNPEIKPGAMVNVKKVGVYSGHYVVTEANHFYDAAGYSCIFYVARDKWGDSSTDEEKKKRDEEQKKQAKGGAEKPYKPPKAPPKKPPPDESIDFTLEGDDGKPLANVKCKIKLKSGEVIEATTDGDGHVQVDEKPHGPYTVQITGDALALTSIDVVADDADAESGGTSGGAGAAEEKEAAAGGGGSHQEAGAAGGGTSEEDDAKGAKESSASGGAASHRDGLATSGATVSGSSGGGAGAKETRPAAGHEATTAKPHVASGPKAGDAGVRAGSPAPHAAPGGVAATGPSAQGGPGASSGAPATGTTPRPPAGSTPRASPGASPSGGTAPGGGATATGAGTAPGAGTPSGGGTAARRTGTDTVPPGSPDPTSTAAPAGAAPVAGPGAPVAAMPPAGTPSASPGAPSTASTTPAPAPPTGVAPPPASPTGVAPPPMPPAPTTVAAPPAAPPTGVVGPPPAAPTGVVASPSAPTTGVAPPPAPASAAAPAPAEGLSPVEIGAIGSGVAAASAVSMGIAKAADGAESIKAAARSVAEKSANNENVEE